MGEKKTESKFTIQFGTADPAHIQVAGILNRLGRYRKAQYIVDAVLHYEGCGRAREFPRQVWQCEMSIEGAIDGALGRLAHDKANIGSKVSSSQDEAKQTDQQGTIGELNSGEAMEALGEDGFSAVVDALDMFRRK